MLQVNDRARKKIQVSAHLIWFPAVNYSPSAFLIFFPVVFSFILFGDKRSPQAAALWKQCHCSRVDSCQLKIWPLPFSLNPSLFLPPAALVSSKLVRPFVTSVSISVTHHPVLLLPAFPPALPPAGKEVPVSLKLCCSTGIEDAAGNDGSCSAGLHGIELSGWTEGLMVIYTSEGMF